MVSLVKGVGIGASVGAGLGALSSDDGYGTGALRGGIAGAGKLAYGQGANILKVNSMLKERGMTWSGVGKAGVGGIGANKFYNGTKAWTPEDQTSIMNKFQNVAGQFNG